MKFDGCPDGMYPVDSDYPNEYDSFDALVRDAESASDVLNFPISWYITHGEVDEKKFELTFLMPRKYGKTWSMYTHDFDPESAETWVLAYTKREAANWFGWGE